MAFHVVYQKTAPQELNVYLTGGGDIKVSNEVSYRPGYTWNKNNEFILFGNGETAEVSEALVLAQINLATVNTTPQGRAGVFSVKVLAIANPEWRITPTIFTDARAQQVINHYVKKPQNSSPDCNGMCC